MNYIVSKLPFLSNPADYLKGNGSGALDPLQETLEGTVTDVYKLLISVGIGALVCALVAAAICFGLFRDTTFVREHKQWIVRIIFAVILVSVALTIVGLANEIGSSIKVGGTGATPTPGGNP